MIVACAAGPAGSAAQATFYPSQSRSAALAALALAPPTPAPVQGLRLAPEALVPTGNPHTDTMMRFHEAHAKERDEIVRLMLKLAGLRASTLTRKAMTKK